MRILVTGASGFVGRPLCESLVHAQHHVIAVTGARTDAPAQGAETLRLNLPDDIGRGRLEGVLPGCDAIVHLAGIAHQRASSADYQRVNIDATAQLVEAAATQGVSRIVYISSALASLADLNDSAITYASSKALAEQELIRRLSGSVTTAVILRPSLVYGPAVRGNLRQLMTAVRYGLPAPPSIGPGRAMIAVNDLVAAIELALQRSINPGSHAECWSVWDGEIYTLQRIVSVFRAAAGYRGRGPELPLWMWRAACVARDAILSLNRAQTNATSSFDQLFGAVASLPDRDCLPGWLPRYRLEDFGAAMWEASH